MYVISAFQKAIEEIIKIIIREERKCIEGFKKIGEAISPSKRIIIEIFIDTCRKPGKPIGNGLFRKRRCGYLIRK